MTAERPETVAAPNADRLQPSRIFVAIKIAAEIADELAQMEWGLERFQFVARANLGIAMGAIGSDAAVIAR
jgi:hypothetical protein